MTKTHDGLSAVTLAREVDPDLLVLDLGLPGLDGVEVCRQIRTFSDAYVVMLTARSEEVDKLIGLSVGADDYMTKPFSPASCPRGFGDDASTPVKPAGSAGGRARAAHDRPPPDRRPGPRGLA